MSSQCSFSAKLCKICKKLYCPDREYETPTVTVRTYKLLNMEKEITAQEIVEKLIDEKKINGKEAVILLNAINKPAEIRIEKEHTPYIPPITTPWYQENLNPVPMCYRSGGTCTDPHMDCINCPKYGTTYTAATREIPNPVEPMMKEE